MKAESTFLGAGEGLESLFHNRPLFPCCLFASTVFSRVSVSECVRGYEAVTGSLSLSLCVCACVYSELSGAEQRCTIAGKTKNVFEGRRHHLLALSSTPLSNLRSKRGRAGEVAMYSTSRRVEQVSRDIIFCFFVWLFVYLLLFKKRAHHHHRSCIWSWSSGVSFLSIV